MGAIADMASADWSGELRRGRARLALGGDRAGAGAGIGRGRGLLDDEHWMGGQSEWVVTKN